MPELLLELPAPTPDRYTTEGDLTASLVRKGTPEPGSGLYPRDGTAEVTEVETALSELTIPDQRSNVVVASGMAAVSGAIRFAMAYQGRRHKEKYDPRPTLARPVNLYGQSTKAIQNLMDMGVSVVEIDPTKQDPIDSFTDNSIAGVVFAETVANTPNMPVFNVQRFLEVQRARGEKAPVGVLDNTLLLSTGLDFDKLITPEDKVLVVESATKGPMHNSGHLGVVYSKNEELIDEFRRFKVTEGIVTSTGIDETILRALEATAPGFHERNRALYESTARLAIWLSRAEEERGAAPEFMVNYPGFDKHPNHEYAAEYLTSGISPVVFLADTYAGEDRPQEMLRKIAEHPSVKEQIEEGQVYLGQSFGFPEATLLYDPKAGNIRVSGGYNIDSEALGRALYEALVDDRPTTT
jgi:cystathionine beta-lyase/cystathionine gamma-synthase